MDLFRVIYKRVSEFKLNKRHIVIALLAVTFSISLYLTIKENSKRDYLYYGLGPEQKIAIPKEIVKLRNCKDFEKWKHENISFVLLGERCPWLKYGEVIHLEIGGMNFSIPTNYIFGGLSMQADGIELDTLTLDFTYPELKGGLGDGKDFVMIFIKSLGKHLKKSKKSALEFGIEYYLAFILNINQEDEFEVIDNGYNEELNRKHYIIKNTVRPSGVNNGVAKELIASGKWTKEMLDEFSEKKKNKPISYHNKHIFTNDDPLKPHEYVVCDDGEDELMHKRFCQSGFFYNGLFIEMHLLKKNLDKFDYMKTEFLTLMKQWEKNYDNR